MGYGDSMKGELRLVDEIDFEEEEFSISSSSFASSSTTSSSFSFDNVDVNTLQSSCNKIIEANG